MFAVARCIRPKAGKRRRGEYQISVNGKKELTRILSCLFFVEGEKFKLRNLPSRTSSVLSVLLRTRSAQRLSLQHFPAVPTPNIAKLVPSVFSVHNHGFCGGPNTSSAIFGVGTAAKCCKLKRCADRVLSRTDNKDEVLEGKFRNLNFSPSPQKQMSILLNFVFPFIDISCSPLLLLPTFGRQVISLENVLYILVQPGADGLLVQQINTTHVSINIFFKLY